jgi:sugar-specific transcriptional regulator TrmB
MVNIEQRRILKQYFRKLGMGAEEAEIYLDLCEHDHTTPLLLARRTGINRTKVYRLIEQMATEKLVEVAVGAKTTMVSPAPLDQLGQKLQQKQRRVAELTQGWGEVQTLIAQLSSARQAETKVKYYQGKSGIQQLVWNVLSAKSEIVGYTTRDLADFVGETFMEEFVAEFLRRKLSMRDVYGDEYLDNKWTQYEWGKRVVSRYVPKKILVIPHQMDIYDGTVSFYRWVGEEVFGVEIINPDVAIMQKQLFELAWERGKPEHGD